MRSQHKKEINIYLYSNGSGFNETKIASRPFVLHQWECQCNLFNKLSHNVLCFSPIDYCIFFLYLIPLKKKKRKKSLSHCNIKVTEMGRRKEGQGKKKSIHLSSGPTSKIKIVPLRCKCLNNILHVRSKLLMYIL